MKVQVMKYSFSLNDQNCEKNPPFWLLWLKTKQKTKRGGKNSWTFGTIPYGTCNFIMQNVSSYW